MATAQSDMSSPVEPEIFVKSTGCTWSDIEFTTSATGIVLWYFDGGTTPLSATGDSVTVQYTTIGRHTITLVVDGVPYIFTDFVGIFNDGTPYLPDIISPDSVICPGTTASFASSYAGLTYEWIVYDGSPTTYTTALINHTFNDTGTYDVTLQTTSPCCGKSKIDTFIVNVVPYLIADVYVSVTSASICDGDQTTFGAIPVNGGPNPTYLWQVNGGTVGDSTNSFTTSTLNDGDVIICIMTSSYACPIGSPAFSLPITITVNPLPLVSCSANRFYLGANTNFTATPTQGTPPYTYNWDFGDSGIDTGATTSHYYGSTGTYYYSVTITDSNGCTGYCSDSLTIEVAPFVAAGFGNSNIIQICDSTTVSFIDTSLGNPDAWYWDFGDGDTSTLQNPTHTYNTPGSYSVTLAATNGVYTDTVTYPNYVVVYASPIAGLSAIKQAGCQPFNSQFLDESYGATSWQWDFGDTLSGANNTSTFQNPNHSYTDTGLYSVELIVGSNNCYDTAYMSISVIPSPVAGFTSVDTLVCTETNVQFTDTSSGAIFWYWDFGDGGTSTDTNPSYIYNYPGIYTVSLIVKNQFGCSDTLTSDSMITVVPNPIPGFTADPQFTTILNPSIIFTDESTDSIISWSWDFGDNSTSTEQNLSHTYMDTGSYTVQLVVVDENGCNDSVSIIVRINPDYSFFIPTAFTPDNNDNKNDEFFPKGVGINENDFHMYIYTRWGELIFETDDIDKHWDGKAFYSNELVQTDIYVWKIFTKDMLGQKHEYVGHVTLIR
ncbi:PKD domain-containing protein, partial [bacterium AH-315-M05]|nr:PKD domain-containing protein [bacterium AH-315-M05]